MSPEEIPEALKEAWPVLRPLFRNVALEEAEAAFDDPEKVGYTTVAAIRIIARLDTYLGPSSTKTLRPTIPRLSSSLAKPTPQ